MRRFVLMGTLSSLLAAAFVFGLFVNHPSKPQDLVAAEPAVRDAVADVLKAREAEILADGEVSFGDKDTINILALGIDSRKDGAYAHCDAIHMVSFHVKTWTVTVTSVPRGTNSPLPPIKDHTYLPTDYYLANACYFGGLEYGVKQIERVAGVKADYVATVGFSEAIGIFRALDLPTTETLEFLRHRRSYQIGDPQRSHNQALFMKDTALKLFSGQKIPTPFLYILYSFIDTDVDFATVKALYDAYYASDIGQRPDAIVLEMKPPYATFDYHYDPDKVDQDVQKLIDFLVGKVAPEDLSLRSEEEFQTELIKYLRATLGDESSIERIFGQQVWRQVEDDAVREELQFRFLDKYVKEVGSKNPEAALQAITDYTLEKEFFDQASWQEKGERFLKAFLREHPELSP